MGRRKKEPLHIDWLKALILERMHETGLGKAAIAKKAGINANRFYRLMEIPVPAWPYEDRQKVLEALQVKIKDLPADVQMEIAQY